MTNLRASARSITPLLGLGLVVVALGACGGTDGAGSEDPTTPITSSTTPSVTEPDASPTAPEILNGAIVFTQDLPLADGTKQTTIRAIDPDGTDVRTILAGAWQPAWSPDGTQIAFSDFPGGVTQVFVMNADGTGVRQVTDLPFGAEHPAWSPDGTRIAYAAYNADMLTSIWTVRAVDGQDPHEVVPGTYDDGNPTMAWEPAWGPDGWIAFSAAAWGDDGQMEDAIFTVRADGTELTRLTQGQGAFAPGWSPDGSWLVFERRHGYDPTTLHVIAGDGTAERQLVELERAATEAAWSPDGTSIVFAMVGDGDEDGPTFSLWIVDSDGTDPRQLYEGGTAPSW